MSLPLAIAGPSAYWYLTRGTGTVSLLLLSVTVVLGILDVERYTAPRWPRFVVDRVHRDVSMLALALLAVHIVTSVLDAFAPISLLDAVIPFHSAYRPLWLGLGAVAFDLMIAVWVTSMLRRRIGFRTWRIVHWLAYASWPVAVLHSLGTGSDATSAWLLALTVLSLAAVLAATIVRVLRARPPVPSVRPAALGALGAVTIGVVLFALLGPLAPHWARRAGTPVALLKAAHPVVLRTPARAAATAPVTRAAFSLPFSAQLNGRARQIAAPGGALVDLVLSATGQIRGVLRVRLAGQPFAGGGLSLTGSQVQLTALGLTSPYQGTIVQLRGQDFLARLTDSGGRAITVHARLNIASDNTVTGTLSGASA
jgi:sulfoxide reductase heme-binding subunit YedZ